MVYDMENQPNMVMKDLTGYLTMEQINRILQAAGQRDRLMFQIAFRCGRRISEVLNLKVKHISQDRDSILFYILKKREPTPKLKAIDTETMNLIRNYTETNHLGQEDYLFKSPYKDNKHLSRQQAFNIFRKLCQEAGIYYIGIKQPHPHHLRHSHAINYLDKSTSASALRMLQLQLEHSRITQTSHYLQFSEKDQREALNRIFTT